VRYATNIALPLGFRRVVFSTTDAGNWLCLVLAENNSGFLAGLGGHWVIRSAKVA